jgi:hypothetical protein
MFVNNKEIDENMVKSPGVLSMIATDSHLHVTAMAVSSHPIYTPGPPLRCC